MNHVFNPQRPTVDGVLRDGHLSLSGLQMRAHAMFSAQGLPLGSDTLEYAWLIDMQAGGLTGRVTVPQVCAVIVLKLYLDCLQISWCLITFKFNLITSLFLFCSFVFQ